MTASAASATVRHLFEEQVRARPDAPAVGSDATGWLSFRDLDRAADRVATRLREGCARHGSRIGVVVPRGPGAVAAVLGAWKVGAAYVPVDTGAPMRHREDVFAHSAVDAVVTADDADEALSATDLVVDPVASALAGEDPAWILYTSGSTGRPKGVIGPHRALLNRCRWMWATSPFVDGEVSVQNTAMTVVDSPWEVWGSLAAGVPVLVPPPHALHDPVAFVELLARHRITRICVVPSMLRALLDAAPPLGERLPCLERWVCSGETLDRALVERFYGDVPRGVLLNQYGLTESCSDITSFDTRRLNGATGAVGVPIGTPITGCHMHVLDESMQPVPVGEVGELYVGGSVLALGYVGDETLTRSRFLRRPGDPDGPVLYRTGDLVRDLGADVFEHLGRVDRQTKVRGFRVEPEGIEATLLGHPAVSGAAVRPRPNRGDTRLDAYVVVSEERAADTDDLRAHLRERLPQHMVPATFTVLDALPLTPSGKTDRAALPNPHGRQLRHDPVAPRSAAERRLTDLWVEVLAVDDVGVTDDFFQLGGDSLDLVRLIARTRAEWQVRVDPSAFARRPTVEVLAHLVENGQPVAPAQQPIESWHGPVPLTPAQEAMWAQEQWSDAAGPYNIGLGFRVEGAFDVGALEWAVNAVVAAHDALRTGFDATHAGPRQVVHAEVPVVAVEVLDGECDLAPLNHRPFDLGKPPLLRASVVRLDEADHLLLLTVHHLVCDGRSIDVLLAEVAAAYGAARHGQRPAPAGSSPAAPRPRREPGHLDAAPLHLATDRPPPARKTGHGASFDFEVPPPLAAAIAARSRALGVTPFVTVASALALAFSAHTSAKKFSIAVPVANRVPDRDERVLGCLIAVRPLALDLNGDPTVAELLARVRDAVWRLDDRPDPAEPLSVMVAYDDAHALSFSLPGARTSPWTVESRTSKLDLTVLVDRAHDRYHVRLEYDIALFDEETIVRLSSHVTAAITELCGSEESRRLSEIAVVPAEELETIASWNDTARDDYPLRSCVHELVAQAIVRHPDALVLFGGRARTHADLDRAANQMARALLLEGLAPGAAVGVHLERSLDLQAVVLAVLKAGLVYLPLEPGQPVNRLAGYVADASAALVVTEEPSMWDDRRVRSLSLDALSSSAQALEPSPPRPGVDASAPAYVVFTSGSTGRPKGVLVSHRSLVNRLWWLQETFRLDPSDCMLLKTPIGADPSLEELLWPFLAGARVEVARPGGHRDTGYLTRTIQAAGVTTVRFVPSMLRLFVDDPAAAGCTSLRRVLRGGEALAPDLAEQTLRVLPAEVFDVYGPTEATIDVTWWPCRRSERPLRSVPIGRPVANCSALVLDDAGRPVPIGVPGELYLGGVQVAMGYIGRPDLTAERFVPHPWLPDERVYRTGDLVRWSRDGQLEFLGRLDRQVQIAGVRVEPGEIEVALRSHPSVADAVVVASGDGTELGLVAYVVPAGRLDTVELRRHVRASVPLAMVPNAVVVLDSLLRLANGKVDWHALPAAAAAAADVAREPATPRAWIEAIWTMALGAAVDPAVGFVEAGGDSFGAAKVTVEVNRALGTTVGVHALLQAATFDEYVAVAEGDSAGDGAGAGPVRPRLDGITRQPVTSQTSVLQERWLALAPTGYGHVDLLAEVRGPIRPELFRPALVSLVERHAVLRSRYERATPPVQRVVEGWEPEGRVTDVMGASDNEVREVLSQAVERSLTRFDVVNDVPFDMELVVVAPDRSFLVGRLHHIATDGWSTSIRLADFERIYAALEDGLDPKSCLPPAPQYVAFAEAQRAYMASDALGRDRDHFRRLFAGAAGPTHLRGTAIPGDGDPDRAQFVNRTWDARRAAALAVYGHQRGVTPFTVIMAAFALTLRDASGEADLVFGTSLAGRQYPRADETLGVFVNPLPVRVDLAGSRRDLGVAIPLVHERLLDLTRHQHYVLADLVEHVPPFVGRDLNAAFDVHLLFQNYPPPPRGSARQYRVIDFQDRSLERPFDLPRPPSRLMRASELIVFARPDGSLSFNFGYKPARITDDQMQGWASTFEGLLTEALTMAVR